jgi:hypothetical protein
MLKAGTVVIAALALIAAGAAGGAAGWRVLAKAENKSEYISFASASVDVNKPRALRIRAFGQKLKLSGYLSCQFDDRPVASGAPLCSRSRRRRAAP